MKKATTETVRDCPCGSGARYRACCGLLHDGTNRAASPEALMRSRYSAFALGLGDYLYDTLAATHLDRQLGPREAVVREISRMREKQRFMKLTIAWSADNEVIFVARIFEKGQDRSFGELSRFVMEDDGAWKYESGVVVPGDRLPDDVTSLDRETFLAIE